MLRSRPISIALLHALVFGALAVTLFQSGPVAGQDEMDAEAKIENAMSAAPSSISAEAKILDNAMDDSGEIVVLRDGDNGWYCWPDTPGSPTDDPMCGDAMWLDWMTAFMHGEAPNTTVTGLAYMLQGGADASNTDPMATEPPAGEDWILSPAHVMLLFPGEIDQTVFTTDYESGGPWIMWAGTDYEHIMMPVADAEPAE